MRSLTFGRFTKILLGVGALLWTPVHLSAQACVGSPALSRQIAADVSLSFTDGAAGYGAGITRQLASPISLSANAETFKVDNVDKNLNRFGFRAAYELPVAELSICPTVGVRYSSFGTTLDGTSMNMSQVLVPLGFGMGKRFELEHGIVLIPSVMGDLLYVRERATSRFRGNGDSLAETATKVGGTIGATLGFNRLFGRGAVSFNKVANSDPVVSISFGLLF